MSPYDVLGISLDADKNAIKKAYAKLIKIHRPDEDPEMFQKIHDAYKDALAYIETGKNGQQFAGYFYDNKENIHEFSESSEYENNLNIEAERDLESRPILKNNFDYSMFYHALTAHATGDDLANFKQWLYQQKELDDVSLKFDIAQEIFVDLYNDHPPIHSQYTDVIFDFFSVDRRRSFYLDVARRLHLSWIFEGDHSKVEPQNNLSKSENKCTQYFRRKYSFLDNILLIFCVPWRAQIWSSVVKKLVSSYGQDLLKFVDSKHVYFWLSGQRTAGGRHVLYSFLSLFSGISWLAWSFIILIILIYPYMYFTNGVIPSFKDVIQIDFAFISSIASFALLISVIYWCTFPLYNMPNKWVKLVSASVIPILLVGSLMLYLSIDKKDSAYICVVVALFMSFFRIIYSSGMFSRHIQWSLVVSTICIFILSLIVLKSDLYYSFAFITGLLWIAELQIGRMHRLKYNF